MRFTQSHLKLLNEKVGFSKQVKFDKNLRSLKEKEICLYLRSFYNTTSAFTQVYCWNRGLATDIYLGSIGQHYSSLASTHYFSFYAKWRLLALAVFTVWY